MRVITGTARGRRLKELPGQETRPTASRVKEGLFSAIQFEIEGRRVLDLFGGTGQLGIECLSRGAAQAVFVEQRPDAAAVIQENLNSTGLQARGRVVRSDALRFLERNREPFDLILLDPPYNTGLLEACLEKIVRIDILRPHGIMTAEHPADRPPSVPEGRYRLDRSYRYGKIGLTVYRRDAEGSPAASLTKAEGEPKEHKKSEEEDP